MMNLNRLKKGGKFGPLRCFGLVLPVAVWLLFPFGSSAGDTLNWRTNQNRVTADIQSSSLPNLLERIASITGWQVFVEPDASHIVSAKFTNLPPGEALRLLLGDLSFALVPQTNAPAKLFVFHTSQQNATRLVRAKPQKGKVIPNELIVTLKPGAKIDELAAMLGAKVVGRIPGLNAYRLQFGDAAAANAARDQLASNPDVTSVDNNYSIDRPTLPLEGSLGGTPSPHLELRPPPANGRVLVGLVDTAVQPLGNDLDRFMLKPISIAGDAQLSPDTPTHGTSMAETVLRGLEMSTKGSTSVQILPVDVYGPNANTSTFEVAQGIVQAVNNGANVINLSLGSEGDSPFLRDVIKDAIQNKIAFFAAAGNEPVTTAFFPAAYSDLGVNAVTAIDHGQLAPYANRGSFVTLGAPGTSLITFDGQQWIAQGTSASSAVATGLAAGYMDSTHSSVDKMQSFITATLGVKISSGK